MDAVSGSTHSIFTSQFQQSNLETLSSRALSNGIDLFLNKDYEGAAKAFKRAVGLARNGPNSATAGDYLAQAYIKLNKTDKAISAYKTAAELNPQRDDLRIKLGDIRYFEGQYEEAEIDYKEAVRINPSAENRFSLGLLYNETGQYEKAERQFKQVLKLNPRDGYGNYGFGLVYNKKGQHEQAIAQFKEAIRLNKDFLNSYAYLGYAYADNGQMDEAGKQIEILEDEDSPLAYTLQNYITKVSPPKIIAAYSGINGFSYNAPRKTNVSSLNSYLETANTSKSFTMKFIFSKSMDVASVQNRFNWEISRASGNMPGHQYNFDLPIPSTEVTIAQFPDTVAYDPLSLTAMVAFTIRQNDEADGTIDPSHIVFKFTGKDQDGNLIDPQADEFSGFSGMA
jgi:tetratricopeptide (TPR) repeat protein